MKSRTNHMILVADDDVDSREQVAGILQSHGYQVIQAVDGGAAIKVIEERLVDIAIVSEVMASLDGFEVVRHIQSHDHKTLTILLTKAQTTDLLLEAGKYRISHVLTKPVEPGRLTEIVRRAMRSLGKTPVTLRGDDEKKYTEDELMERAIALAQYNAQSGMGGPFGALVASADGRILGEGGNGVTTRCDPTAHAEVVAIRRATESINSPRLDGCAIFCSSEPTMLGQALIISTGIGKVHYGLSHEDIGSLRTDEEGIVTEILKPVTERAVPYRQMHADAAQAMFKAWQKSKTAAAYSD